MQTKPVRISVEAQAIALQYGKTVSQGIIEMDRRIHTTPIHEQKPVIGTVGAMTEERFFANMKSMVTQCVFDVCAPVKPKVPESLS